MDHCKHCVLRGDIDLCRAQKCNQHESWYAQEQIKEIERLREERDAMRAKLVAIEQDGTAEHNAAVELRAEVARLRDLVNTARKAICGPDWSFEKWVSPEGMTVAEWKFVDQYRRYASEEDITQPVAR